MKISNKKIKYIFFFIVIFLLFLGIKYYQTTYIGDISPYLGKWQPCIEFLKQNILYQEEPNCYVGPLTFLTGAIFKNIFKEHYHIAFSIFAIILSTIIFLTTLSIIKKKLKKSYFLIPLLLFIFIFISSKITDISAIMSTTFLILIFYILFYTKFIYKESFVAILTGIIIFLNQPYVFPLFIIFLLYIIHVLELKISIKNKPKISFNYNKIPSLIKLIIFIIIISIVIILTYPKYFTYTLALKNELGLSVLSSLKSLIINTLQETPIIIVILAAIFILALYSYFKEKTTISKYLLIMVLITIYLNAGGNTVIEYKRLCPLIPFFIILFTKYFYKFKEQTTKINLKYILFLFILIIFIFQGAKLIHLEHQIYDFNYKLSYPLSFWPVHKNTLTNLDDLKYYFSKKEYLSTLDILDNTLTADPYAKEFLKKAELFNECEWNSKIINMITSFQEKVKNNIYDGGIILNQRAGRNYLMTLVVNPNFNPNTVISKEQIELFRKENNFSCTLQIANIRNSEAPNDLHRLRLILKDKQDCRDFQMKTIIYYQKNFKKFCYIDKSIADELTNSKHIKGTQQCEFGGNLLERYQYKHKITPLTILLSLLVTIGLYKLTHKKTN